MRIGKLLLVLITATMLTACSDDGGPSNPALPLQISSTTPAAGAAAVETGATVTVVFNQAINLATLTTETFRVRREGVSLPAAVMYDAVTNTGRLSVPFLPDVIYAAEVTTGVRSLGGMGLGAAHVWSFTTRPWQPVTVDAAGEMTYSSLAVDAVGRVHASYQDYTNRDLRYARCLANCTTSANWQSLAVDGDGDRGSYSSLAVDGGGRVHVSYHDFTNLDLRYTTCAASCTTAANWQSVTIDAVGTVGAYSSLAVDAGGRVHVSYSDATNGDLKYASCAGDCATAGNWQSVTMDAAGFVGYHTSLEVDAGGRVHVSYHAAGPEFDLKYATCMANCVTAGNWQSVTVDAAAEYVGFYTSLAVDGGGRVHVSHYDLTNDDLKYATCATSCATATNWQSVVVDAAGDVGSYTSLAVDGRGRVHVMYYDITNSDLKYATCAATCAAAPSWQRLTVDADGDVGLNTSLAVEGGGRVHVSYIGNTGFDLKYIE